VDFYTLFDNVVKSYRPGGPSFWHYLVHVCFRNYCVREGERLRKRAGRESSLDSEDSELRYATKLVDASAQSSPGRLAQSRAFAEDLAAFLEGDHLPERQRQVFVLRYLEDLPYERIAEEVGSPVGSVKGWLNRATIAARAYLSARGWAEWQIGI
jgi:RNA polymerase sigma factor (sigma-70 family)